jgi:tetratricopeptide (TPR) repeat protein
MRFPRLVVLALALAAGGCASLEKSYRDFALETPLSLTSSAPSAEVDALVARFYGAGGVDARAIADALARAPTSPTLHEIAGYEALVRADAHAAFEHFLAAAADQNATVPELYLWEMRSLARSTTEHLRAQALLRAIKDRHPRPLVRQLAAYDLARELARVGELEEAGELVRGLAFIDEWQVLGAFDNEQGKGLLTEYPPEPAADLAKSYAGVLLPIHFRPIRASTLDGALHLDDVIWPNGAAVAYAEAFVRSPHARQVELRLTTTNAVRVFVGDKMVATDDNIFHDELDNVIVQVPLAAGDNRILVKSAHLGGPFRLAARITELDGTLPADLRYAATLSAAPASPSSGRLVSPAAVIDKLEDKNRRRFLEARLWWREGHSKRAAYYLSPLLAEHRENPTLMLFGALALLENAEAGKALDLFRRGAERHPAALAFRVEQARFFAQHRLWDKAEKDLASVLAAAPGARDARMELARLHGARGFVIEKCLDLQAIVERSPDDEGALAELGRCKLERGYVEEAERTLRRARALAPGDAPVLEDLLRLAERRLDHTAAEGLLRDVAAVRPGSLSVLLEEAEILRRQGKPAEARRALEAAEARSPDAPFAYDRLAQIAQEAGDRAGAEKNLRLALEREPEDAAVAQRLAALAPNALPLGDRLAPTDDDIDRAVRSAAHVKVHPGSHVVVLLDDQVSTVNADGSNKAIVTRVSQAVTTTGRDALIQAPLHASGRVVVTEAYAIQKNGERQDAASIQGGIIRFRNLDVGSITVLKYASFAPRRRFLPNEYASEQHFQMANAQIESSRWRIVLPKDHTLQAETRGPVERAEEVVGDQRVVSFSAKHAPPLVPEPNMTAMEDELWMAGVSTLKSWDGYVRWESALLAEAFGGGPELDALAKKLTAGAPTARDKLDRLSAFVAQEIRYQQDYEDTIAGVKPHAAAMVLERRYGDCKDKAVLLIRLARAVGVDLVFALLRTVPKGKVRRDLPNQQFNHAIVYAPQQPGLEAGFFIDPTTNSLDVGNMRTDDEGALSLIFDRQGHWEFRTIPYQDAERELVRHDIKVALGDPAKAVLHDHVDAKGGLAAGMRVAIRSAEGAKKYYQGLSDQLFPGTTLLDGKAEHPEDLGKPLSVHLDVDATNALRTEDDHLRFEVPVLFPIAHAAALATRQHPLRLWRGVQELAMDVDLGDKQRPAHVPADFTVEHPCFAVARRTESKGTHVVVHTRFKNTCAEVGPAEYPAFRAAVQKVLAKMEDAIVFTPAKVAPPPSR